ncbi:MAG: ribokinase [Desulfobulbia bacterium]
MKIINFGSLNIDRVYQVERLVRPGETITSRHYQEFAGGKGLNQSIALARGGVEVSHAGKIGTDGSFLVEFLAESGVDVSLVFTGHGQTGHAIIQVDVNGENSIVLFAGENRTLTIEEVGSVIDRAEIGDYLLLQNEINFIEEIIKLGSAKGLNIVFNPAPITPDVLTLPLDQIKWLIVNEVEGKAIAGKSEPSQIMDEIVERYPTLSLVLTLGGRGVHYGDSQSRYFVPAEEVEPIDTTAAGDTFIGYFIAEIVRGSPVVESLITANKAASLCVTRPGAADSIPRLSELR